ncbi:MAG: acyl-CoA dehydrogenase family protein [Halioglobus sp.]|nr:acyl-CoA dehydrogenase family protein [Halioglobus sp.]
MTAAHWRRLVELGVTGPMAPESAGVVGGDMSDTGVVMEEMGRGRAARALLVELRRCHQRGAVARSGGFSGTNGQRRDHRDVYRVAAVIVP